MSCATLPAYVNKRARLEKNTLASINEAVRQPENRSSPERRGHWVLLFAMNVENQAAIQGQLRPGWHFPGAAATAVRDGNEYVRAEPCHQKRQI